MGHAFSDYIGNGKTKEEEKEGYDFEAHRFE